MRTQRPLNPLSMALGVLTLVLLVTIVTACASGAQVRPQAREITIDITDSGYQPAKVEVKPGESITFVLNNRGSKDYEFESDELHIEEVVVAPGKSKRLEWTAPNRTGTFEAEDDKNGFELEIIIK